ncbi:MAG: GGDEF domain-containing protein [Spirochaetales bacterium]|nr:GGDEF domain-containing protein [Spirochaetales bacterium]
MGTEEHIAKQHLNSLILNYILFGALLIMGLYHFSLYGLRREDKSPLYFGIYCLIMTSRILVTNEMQVMEIMPCLSWENHLRVIVLGYYIAAPVFFTYISILYPDEFPKRIIRIMQITGAAFSLVVILSPPALFTKTELIYQLIILAGIVYLIYGLVRAIINRRDQALLLMIGIILISAATINDILYAQYLNTFIPSLVPLGLTLFILFQSYIISARFARAYATANTDMLTQIPNRRRFMEQSESDFHGAEGSRKPLNVLFMDIDHFKVVNDRYGHDNGDIVLRHFASILESVVKSPDYIGRLGGEEFALMVHGSEERALQIAEEIRRKTGEAVIEAQDYKIQITVSIGISSNQAAGNISLKKLLKSADQCLYRAKENGRNRVELQK